MNNQTYHHAILYELFSAMWQMISLLGVDLKTAHELLDLAHVEHARQNHPDKSIKQLHEESAIELHPTTASALKSKHKDAYLVTLKPQIKTKILHVLHEHPDLPKYKIIEKTKENRFPAKLIEEALEEMLKEQTIQKTEINERDTLYNSLKKNANPKSSLSPGQSIALYTKRVLEHVFSVVGQKLREPDTSKRKPKDMPYGLQTYQTTILKEDVVRFRTYYEKEIATFRQDLSTIYNQRLELAQLKNEPPPEFTTVEWSVVWSEPDLKIGE